MGRIYIDWKHPAGIVGLGSLEVSSLVHGNKDAIRFTPTCDGTKLISCLGLSPDCINGETRAGVRNETTDSNLFLRAVFDSAPDFWGQRVLKEKERESARLEGRRPRRLGITDYLPINYQLIAKGSIRFRYADGNGESSPEAPLSTFKELARVEHGMRLIESRRLLPRDELDYLSRVSSSLGGARPKTNYVEQDGSLWIAKFPSFFDEWDVEAWEMVCLVLAKRCGLTVSEAKLIKASNGKSTLLVKRFDRIGATPVPFLSAKVFAGTNQCTDENSVEFNDEQYSYLDIARFLKSQDVSPNELREAWVRIVFNMAISNTDDHIKNHGYLYSYADNKWHLSPAYDITPNPFGEFLTLAVDEVDRRIDFNLALSVAECFGVDAADAAATVSEIRRIVSSEWRPLARRFGVNESEIDLMTNAFL